MIKALRLYLSLSICCCFVACHDNSVDDAIDPTVEGRVPIALSISGPQFRVSVDKQAPGRRNAPTGRGTLEGWGEDGKLWKEANFHVFAYQTQNEVNGQPNGLCDMQADEDIQKPSELLTNGSVLLYNRIMRVQSSNGDAQLYADLTKAAADAPATFYYPTGDQRMRYKFYAYYADNLEADIHRNASTVTGDITIDGRQDVMHAFAYHTFDDFWEFITDLKENKGVTSNELRLLCNPDDKEASRPIYNNYLYSTVAAHRGFQPRFHLNRLMTRLNVYVAGGGVYGDNVGPKDYQNLVVTGLSIRNTKTKGTITIANDSWTETSYQADSANIISWDPTSLQNLDFPLESRIPFVKIVGEDTVENESFYDASIYPQVASIPELQKDYNHINIRSTTPVRLAEPLLLAPSDSYTIHLDMLYAHRSTTNKDELDKDNPYLHYEFETTVRLKGAEGESLSFQQGRQYNIYMYVFGPQEIDIKVEIDKPWYGGGTIRVDEEQGYDYDPTKTKL